MARATRWVETNRIDPKLDKDQEAYKNRVLHILQGAATDRAARGTRSAANAAKKHGLDPTTVAAAARIYYTKMLQVREKRPKKILEHKSSPTLGRSYYCLWSDVGYASQDYKLWKSEDYVMQFEGLLEDYKKVTVPMIHPDHSFCLILPAAASLPVRCSCRQNDTELGRSVLCRQVRYHAVRFFLCVGPEYRARRGMEGGKDPQEAKCSRQGRR